MSLIKFQVRISTCLFITEFISCSLRRNMDKDRHYIFRALFSFLLATGALSKLQTDNIPSHYSLDVILDPRADTYDGLVEITFTATNLEKETITLHASPETIKIQDALLNFEHSCILKDTDNSTEVATFECPKNSLREENSFVIHFTGTFSTDSMKGLYKSTYTEDGEDNVLLATQFEHSAARRAFPCFDEPNFKATFDIFITHPIDYNALGNTEVVKQFSVDASQIQTQFDTTPVMSTYLVAFIVSKFESSSSDTEKNYDARVFSRPGAQEYINLAVNYGPVLIDLLSNWTGIEYQELGNTQAYQVAIPDFAAGAMENWGLITFREVDLLDDKDTTSNSAKQRIITTIAHELAHQWFGDFVTLNWWSDVWLNEGFATYFEYYIPDQLDDKLDTMKQFIVDVFQPVLLVDSVPSALSLSSDVNDVNEISNKFDDVSYSKGGSVIWMLKNILGEEAFREGLNTYLITYNYNNTDPTDLLSSFSADTPWDIDTIMKNWIYKSGFPLVTATLNGSNVILTQERFLLQNTTDAESTEWYIPISYTTGADPNFDVNISTWLYPKSTVEIELEDDSWIVINSQQAGYYRVNYDQTLFHRIVSALEDNIENVHVINRAQLVDDSFNIARAGQLSYEMVFHLAEYLESETAYYPWVSAFNALSFIRGKLNDDEAEELLRVKILNWISKAFPSDRDVGKNHVDILKEVLVLNWACKLGQEECIEYVSKTFQDYKAGESLPDYNKRPAVLCYGFRDSSDPEEDYEFLFSFFENSTSAVEKNEIIAALGCTENPDILLQYLEETISTQSSIRKQDGILVYRAVFQQSAVGVSVSLDFLEKNVEAISTRFKGMQILSDLILELANRVISDGDIDRLTKIITDNSDLAEVKLISQRAIEIMQANKNWSDKYAQEIKKILQESPNGAAIPEPTFLVFLFGFTVIYLFGKL